MPEGVEFLNLPCRLVIADRSAVYHALAELWPGTIVDALTYAGNRANLDGLLSDRCSLVECDIHNTELIKGLLREHRLTTIVHFAAESHVDRSIEGPDIFIETNILGTHSLKTLDWYLAHPEWWRAVLDGCYRR